MLRTATRITLCKNVLYRQDRGVRNGLCAVFERICLLDRLWKFQILERITRGVPKDKTRDDNGRVSGDIEHFYVIVTLLLFVFLCVLRLRALRQDDRPR
jgi:hypothetical protein